MARSNSSLSRVVLRAFLALLLSTPIILLLLSLQTTPAIPTQPQLTREELSRIEQLLLENTPQSPTNASTQLLHLNGDELNLLLRYGIEVLGLSSEWSANADLADDLLRTNVSIAVMQQLPLFVNLHASFGVHDDFLQLDALYFGELKVPDRFLQFVLDQLREEIASSNTAYEDFSELFRSVESVTVNSTRMEVTLNWDPALVGRISNQAQQFFISENDQQLISRHYQRIGDIAITIPADLRAVSLNTFLVPMFVAARENSRAGGDPIADNRTLFQALAVYVNDEDIAQLVGQEKAAAITPPRKIEVRLQRRQDLAQHLVSIAAITASAGANIAELLSTTKEAYDARYRSGFSFSDLTANTVGVSIASLATRDAASAIVMQDRMSQLTSEADYMPEVGSNRDGLSETDFNTLYQDRSSPEYQSRLAEIEELIAARPLFLDLD